MDAKLFLEFESGYKPVATGLKQAKAWAWSVFYQWLLAKVKIHLKEQWVWASYREAMADNRIQFQPIHTGRGANKTIRLVIDGEEFATYRATAVEKKRPGEIALVISYTLK